MSKEKDNVKIKALKIDASKQHMKPDEVYEVTKEMADLLIKKKHAVKA